MLHFILETLADITEHAAQVLPSPISCFEVVVHVDYSFSDIVGVDAEFTNIH